MATEFLGRRQEWARGPDNRRHSIETFTESGAAALHRSSGRQVMIDGKHIAWARDEEELAALLGRVRKAIGSGWSPDVGELPDAR